MTATATTAIPRLKQKYRDDIVPALQAEFNPISDMNDLQIVKDKLKEAGWVLTIISYATGQYEVRLHRVTVKEPIIVFYNNETRAVLEAALSAERGKG